MVGYHSRSYLASHSRTAALQRNLQKSKTENEAASRGNPYDVPIDCCTHPRSSILDQAQPRSDVDSASSKAIEIVSREDGGKGPRKGEMVLQ